MVNLNRILWTFATGALIAGVASFGSSTKSIRSEDVNSDGLVDIVLTNGFGRDTVFFQKKDGTYEVLRSAFSVEGKQKNAETECHFGIDDYRTPKEALERPIYQPRDECR